MTSEGTAEQIVNKITLIRDKAREIEELANDVLRKRVIDGDVIDLSDEDKQKLIQDYQGKKAELATLVSQLP